MNIAIIGGGIGGLTLALQLHARKFGGKITVFEAVDEMKPLGVGINLFPHAMGQFTDLGLQEAIRSVAVEAREFAYFTHNGQFILSEPCGLHAGYDVPHFSIHRGDLHMVLYAAVVERLGRDAVVLGHRCTGVTQEGDSVCVHFRDSEGTRLPVRNADAVVACDGVHSAIRRQFYPAEGPPVFHGINLWRGVTRARPFLTGASVTRIGGLRTTNKLLFYPIRHDIDGNGTQLVNWTAEVISDVEHSVDWNKEGRLEDFYPLYQDWAFDWLDAPWMLRNADIILSLPMTDRDPVSRWSFGRTTLLGDAAHPMYPRGGNGGAQAILDAGRLAEYVVRSDAIEDAFRAYESERIPATSKVVLENRTAPPDLIIDTVEELSGGKPFERLEDLISIDELRAISANYQKLAGWDVASLARMKRS